MRLVGFSDKINLGIHLLGSEENGIIKQLCLNRVLKPIPMDYQATPKTLRI